MHKGQLQRDVRIVISGHGAQGVKDQPRQGIIFPVLQFQPHSGFNIPQLGVAGDPPGGFIQLLYAGFRVVCGGRFAVQIPYQLFQQVVQGQDSHHAAVFIQHHRHGLPFLPHVAEKHIGLHRFRHKIGLPQGMGHNVLAAFILQAEIVLGIQDTYHIVRRLVADRVQGVAGGVDGLGPLCIAVFQEQQIHVRPVGGDLPGCQIIKFKHVLDESLFLLVDGALLSPGFHQHTDLLLAGLFFLLVGVNAQQPQHPVGGYGKEPYHGLKQFGDAAQQPGDGQSHGFGLFHGDALGHQFPEDQGKIRQDQCDQNNGQGFQCPPGNACDPQTDEPVCQRAGKTVCGKGAAQKARQGDGDLNGGKEAGRLLRQFPESPGLFAALLRQLFQLCFADGKHGDLRTGKDAVQGNEYHLYQK